MHRPTVDLSEEMPAPDPVRRDPVDEPDACIERNLPAPGESDRHIRQASDLDGQTARACADAEPVFGTLMDGKK